MSIASTLRRALYDAIKEKGNSRVQTLKQSMPTNSADNIDQINNNGSTRLMLEVVSATNVETIQELINAGANVNARDKHGGTSLMYASSL